MEEVYRIADDTTGSGAEVAGGEEEHVYVAPGDFDALDPPCLVRHAGELEEEEEADAADRVPKSFFCKENMIAGQPCMITGVFCGLGTGFIGSYTTLYEMSTNCGLYMQELPCTTLSNAKCKWTDDAEQPCVWREEVNCFRQYTDANRCSQDPSCAWSFSSNRCENQHGYTVVEKGVFAGAMVLGCMLSSFISGYVCRRLGLKRTIFVAGCLGVIACVGYHVCTAFTLFPLLIVSRIILGFANGFCTVASLLYVNVNAHPKYTSMLGMLFQLFSCVGVLLASVVAILVGQTINVNSSKNADLKGRMQGFSAVASFISLLVVGLGLWMPAGKALPAAEEGSEPHGNNNHNNPLKEYGYWEMAPRLGVGIALAASLQLTGLNAVMSFAPTIMETIGMQPFIGNLLVMAWLTVTTVISVPLTSLASVRTLFLWSALGASLSCIFLCGIPVYPGVATTTVMNGFGITGILLYLALFELGVGPCFYVLAQDMFPPSFRPKGASIVNSIQFFFTILINAFYPSATMAASGGASGNQDKGQAVAFLFFGGVGLVCFVVCYFFMHPWEEVIAEDSSEEDSMFMMASTATVDSMMMAKAGDSMYYDPLTERDEREDGNNNSTSMASL